MDFEIPKEIVALQTELLDTSKTMDKRITAGNEMASTIVGGRLLIYLAVENKLSKELVRGISKAIFANPMLEIRTLASHYFDRNTDKQPSISKILRLMRIILKERNCFPINVPFVIKTIKAAMI